MPSSLSSAHPANTLRVLYVEDQEQVRLVVAAYLRHFGHEVETACDGREGWEKFSQARFDLVITDLDMPVLDGIGLIRLLRSSARPIRIIVHSAAFSEPRLAELKQLSVDATIPKGSLIDALLASVEQIAASPA